MKGATRREAWLAGLGALAFFLLSANLFCEPCAQPGVINKYEACRDPISRAGGHNCAAILGFEALDPSTAVAASLFVGVMLFFALKARAAESKGLEDRV